MKLKFLLTMLILSLSICISAAAESSSCITESPSNITYYEALISGTFNTTNNEEYGFELWEESGSVIKIIVGNGTYSGTYSKELILIDNTRFSYRTYIKSADNNYYIWYYSNF